MFARIPLRRALHTGGRSYSISVAVAAATSTAVGWWYFTPKVYNDSDPAAARTRSRNWQSSPLNLNSVAWGSNKNHTLLPEANATIIRTPSIVQWLEGVGLRDLQLHATHGACVDARGDVYQWGDGFFHGSETDKKPRLTLVGKNIKAIQLCAARAFALSASGKIYALGANKITVQEETPSLSWFEWLFTNPPQPVDFCEILPSEPMARGEKFVSISAGEDHLLALSSSGRTFAVPVSKKANSHGQLGFSAFTIPDPTLETDGTRLQVELTPKTMFSKSESYWSSTPSPVSENLIGVDDNSIRFCDRLFEIPSLKGVGIAQVATGGRSSFALTTSGRVLGWGANEAGQIGLSNVIPLPSITVPTEVVLWNSPRQPTKCLNVSAGGDLTVFTVERDDGSASKTVDVVTCGNGQFGGLGSNSYSNAQGTPLRVKMVSGVKEYDEKTKSMHSILPHTISVSSTGHVLLTLDTLSRDRRQDRDLTAGRDFLLWGKNSDSELGNGKSNNRPVPSRIDVGEGQPFILGVQDAEVKDMRGQVWKKTRVEQRAVAGPSSSLVYWKIGKF